MLKRFHHEDMKGMIEYRRTNVDVTFVCNLANVAFSQLGYKHAHTGLHPSCHYGEGGKPRANAAMHLINLILDSNKVMLWLTSNNLLRRAGLWIEGGISDMYSFSSML